MGGTGAVFSPISQAQNNASSNQNWIITALGDGIYKIDAYLGRLTADIAKLNLYNYLGTPCQQYRLERSADGFLVFSSVNGNRVVEVPNASLDDGAQLALWDYNGYDCQK